jgi:hypothetical protein
VIKLTKGQTNSNIALTLTEKVTLSPVYFLFEFKNDTSNTKYYVISSDTSTETERYNLFSITEGVDDQLNGSVILGDSGFYTYTVYEQSSSSNLDPSGLDIVETGKMKLLGTAQSFTEHSITTEYVTHDPTS